MPKPRYWDVWRSVRDTKQQFSNHQVQDALKASGLSKLQGLALDSTYWGVSLETWKLILAYNGTDKKRYVKDTFDCDNFRHPCSPVALPISSASTVPVS